MSSRRFLPLLTLPCLLAFSSLPDEPAFSPDADSELSKTFVSKYEFVLDDFSAIVDGQDVGGMLGSLQFTGSGEQSVRVLDRYGASEDGKPLDLKRTFEALAASFHFDISHPGGSQSDDVSSSSELEGQTVHFRWNEEQGDYDAEFEGGRADEDELLEGLQEDMDLRFLLPQGPVSPGATWEVDLRKLMHMATPGGDLSFEPQDADMPEDAPQLDQLEELVTERLGSQLDELLDGKCECVYVGAQDVDGRQIGEIGVKIEVGVSADLAELLVEVIASLASEFGEEAPPIDFQAAELTIDYEGEGTLSWDLAAGRLHAFQVAGDMNVAFDVSVSAEAEGESHSAEVSVEASGNVEQTVEVQG
jgi:hypothetical protein